MTATLFEALVAVMGALFAYAIVRTRQGQSGFALIAAVVTFWIVIPGILANQHLLDRYSPLPAPALVIVLLVTLGTVGVAFSPVGARLAALPLAGLVGFQSFRIPVELLLHRLYEEGQIPVQMTYSGMNFDIVTGITGAALALWIAFGSPSKTVVIVWNILGLLLLANIVTIAVLSTPVPFRYFMNEPANLLPSRLPYIWLPTFLVQAALFGHLLVFRRMTGKLRSPRPVV